MVDDSLLQSSTRSKLILLEVGYLRLLALGLVGLDFLLRLHTLERIVTLCLFIWSVGLLSVYGDT